MNPVTKSVGREACGILIAAVLAATCWCALLLAIVIAADLIGGKS